MSSVLVLAAATIAVSGSVQFWERTCDASGKCGLPTAVTDRFAISGEVKEPTGPGKLEVFDATHATPSHSLKFQVFWVAPPDGSKPYLVAQSRVKEGERLVTECTQYADAGREVYFPVGMCSGYEPKGDGARQVGVTFYK